MIDVGIGAMRTILPPNLTLVEELEEYRHLSVADHEFISTVGIETVGVIDESAANLASRVLRDIRKDYLAPIDLIIHVAARSPDRLLSSEATKVQFDAGIEGALAITLDGNGCAGSSVAAGLAVDLIRSPSSVTTVAIVYASRPTGLLRVRAPMTVVGDGACAIVLGPSQAAAMVAYRAETNGRFHDLLSVDYRSSPDYEWVEQTTSAEQFSFDLTIQTQKVVRRMVQEVLSEAGIELSDVRAVVSQNLTSMSHAVIEEVVGRSLHSACSTNLRQYGHLGAMDMFLNLERALRDSEDGYVLAINNSPSAAWTVSLWRI